MTHSLAHSFHSVSQSVSQSDTHTQCPDTIVLTLALCHTTGAACQSHQPYGMHPNNKEGNRLLGQEGKEMFVLGCKRFHWKSLSTHLVLLVQHGECWADAHVLNT